MDQSDWYKEVSGGQDPKMWKGVYRTEPKVQRVSKEEEERERESVCVSECERACVWDRLTD